MEETLSEGYVSFKDNTKQCNTSVKFFEWILNYPLFNEIKNSNLSSRFSILCLNDRESFCAKPPHILVKRKSERKKEATVRIKEPNELTTNLIKEQIRKDDYSIINNNKFYVSIIKKSEKIYNTYNDGLNEEREKKKIFEKVKERYLKKKENIEGYVYPPFPSSSIINKKEDLLLNEEYNPFFNFFEKDINKNIYHNSINFSLKTNIQLNRYFYKVISNQLKYYRIKKDVYVIILNIINEVSKYYYTYGYDILNNIKIKYFPYKNISNSFYINGLVFSNCSIYFDNVEIKNPKILLLDSEKEIKFETLDDYYNENYNYTYFILKKVSNRNLNIILVHGEIDYYIKKLLINKKIYFFTSIKKKNIFRLSNILRTKILSYDNFRNFDSSYIARANYFKIQKYKKNVKNIFLCCNNKFLTICIFGKKEIRHDILAKKYDESVIPPSAKLGSNMKCKNEVRDKGKNMNIFEILFKKEVKKENIFENFLQVYYKNKSDDYIVDYYFLNKEKRINFSGKEKKENKKKLLLISHLKNIIIIKKVKKLLRFCIYLSFHIYKQLYLNTYMGRICICLPDKNISTNIVRDKLYNKISKSILYSSFFFFFNNSKKIKTTPINFMYNLFHLININNPLTRERMKTLHSLVKTLNIIKEQTYNNFEHCFFNIEKNKIIDIVNYFLFNSFMKNCDINYHYIYYYLKIVNSTYLYYSQKNIIIKERDLLNDANILVNPNFTSDTITVENKINEKVEKIIAQNILFYSYNFETVKNIEMITYFICPNYMFINNVYNNINIYLFDNRNYNSKKLFFNFFFNHKYIFDISLQQFVFVIYSLSFHLTCPFDLCRNYLCYHQICIQVFLKRVLILIKKENKEDLGDDIIMNIICTKCNVMQERIINIQFSFSEFLLSIIHSDNCINVQCNHNGRNNSYELNFKNIKICFHVHDSDIYKTIFPYKSGIIHRHINNDVTINKNKKGIDNNRDKSTGRFSSNVCLCVSEKKYKCKSRIATKELIRNYIKKNIKRIIYNNVFYYFPCKCVTKRYGCKYENMKKRKEQHVYTNFNLYTIIENFPFFTSSMLPMYCSLKYLIYNCVIKYYRLKNKHLYVQSHRTRRKKEHFYNPYSPLYFKNKCKKCKYIKISNFSTLGFFNVLFIIKRIFYNFYISLNFLIGVLSKNMFIKINEIFYCVNNRYYFVEDNFLLIKENFNKSEEKRGKEESNLDSIRASRVSEICMQDKNGLIKSVIDEEKNNDKADREINNMNVYTHTINMNSERVVLYRNQKDSEYQGEETDAMEICSSCTNVVTSKPIESNHNIYILNNINRIKENLIKQFILYRKFKNKMERYRKYLIRVLVIFYFYAVVYLKKKQFFLDIEIFFSFYIMMLEKLNLKIQKDIEKMEKLMDKQNLRYLHFFAKGRERIEKKWATKMGRKQKQKQKQKRMNLHPPMRKIKMNKRYINSKKELVKKWKDSKTKYAKLCTIREKCSFSNLSYFKKFSGNKSELDNYFYFVREYDVRMLYMKESYYIYNIESYRKKKYIDDMSKEEFENSNKKLFYMHILKIIDSVKNEVEWYNKNGEMRNMEQRQKVERKIQGKKKKKKKKKNCAFLYNQSDISNLIFNALISDDYKTQLKQIFDKENEKIMNEMGKVEDKDEDEDEVKVDREDDRKNVVVKNKNDANKRERLNNSNHSAEVLYEHVKKFLKKNISKLSNHFLKNNQINVFLNCKNNDVVIIVLNDNVSVYIYFPLQFYYLRKLLCKGESIFLKSLTKSNYINFDHKKRHFVKSYDDRYIIKEINKHEFKSFISRYKEFFKHFSDIFFRFKKSLLCFMYGLYQIEMKKKNRKTIKTYIILENVKIENTNSKILIFDIKGARKKKNLQKLMKQNKKSSVPLIFEKDDTISLNTSKILTEKKDILDDNSSGISANMKYFTKYLRMEKQVNFKCIPNREEDQQTEVKKASVIYSKKNYLKFLSVNNPDRAREQEKGEKNDEDIVAEKKSSHQQQDVKEQVGEHGNEAEEEEEYEKKEDVVRLAKINDVGKQKEKKSKPKEKYPTMQTDKKQRSAYIRIRRSNEERMKSIYANMRKKMLYGLYYNEESLKSHHLIVDKFKKYTFLTNNRKNAQLLMNRKKKEKRKHCTKTIDDEEENRNIFLNAIVHDIRMYLFLNNKILKLIKKKNIRKKKQKIKCKKKKLRNKYLYGMKATLHFLTKKKEYILSKDNLKRCKVNHKKRYEEGTFDFLNKESTDSKNFDNLNSIEKYNNFLIDNYNSLKGYTILFDDNFRDFIKSKVINLEYNDYKYLMDSLNEDTNFLSSQDIMDYSLLIHIDISNFEIIFKIIDYLRPYTWDKSVENFSKSVLYLTKGYRPTIIQSEYYKKRFLSNIKKYIFYYIPIYSLKKKIVFKIGNSKGTFPVVTLDKSHPYKTYFFYNLFNIIIRYYTNFYVYMKLFNSNNRLLHENCFAKNIYSQKNIMIFLSYYFKEYFIQNNEEKKENYIHLSDPYSHLKNITTCNFFPYNVYSNSLKKVLTICDTNRNEQKMLAIKYNSSNIDSNMPYLNKEQTTNIIYEDSEYLHSTVLPYITLEQCALRSSNNDGNTRNTACRNTVSGNNINDLFPAFSKNNICFSNCSGNVDLASYMPSISKMNSNFFSSNNYFDEAEFEKLKKKFYKRISEFQIKILKNLQKNKLKIENASYYVQNNVYLEMNDVNMHYTNINYLDAFNIFNICENSFNNKCKRGRRRKKEQILLYIPSYFLFVLNK
ncbi:conserved Plasmodium protein, unknown function [Plasmodium malariae]|uniref:1-phosphatidylinositol-3-phosphate 5-kinase n=1 Tax=Plasmodium malariae TaxID=5858 RepID=A0A1C3KFL9_PLAMA|nr:conserved Plasmodium protein, unknown function [Plasmodium malariae]